MSCIFCKIINNELPSHTLYEDDVCKAILDIAPASIGHTVVILKKHAEDIFELHSGNANSIFGTVAMLAKKIKKAAKADGINILQNNGASAGQTVQHFHIHIIPRYENDNVTVAWRQLNPTTDELKSFAERVLNDEN